MNQQQLKAQKITFSGLVQGVGFRWTIAAHAERLKVYGTVSNLDNGTVELFVEGSKEGLQNFLEEVLREPGHAGIENYQVEEVPLQMFDKFLIKR